MNNIHNQTFVKVFNLQACIYLILPLVYQTVLVLMEPDKFFTRHDTCHAIVSAIWFAVPHIRFICL